MGALSFALLKVSGVHKSDLNKYKRQRDFLMCSFPKERIFETCVGYEINPLLHLVALAQRTVYGPQYWVSASFYLQDIWKTSLHSTHVVAVVNAPVKQPACLPG